MSGTVNVIALVRGEEQYIFLFDEANRTETLRMLGRYAADPELSFTWYDAAIMSQKVREMLPANKIDTSKKAVVGKSSSDGPSVQSKRPRFNLPARDDSDR